MDQEVAELKNRIIEVIAENRLSEVLYEDASDGTTVVEHSAVMARAGPQLVALDSVVDQRTEERRLQSLRVLFETADEVSRDEVRCFLGEKDVAVDMVENFNRHVFQALAAHEENDR